jgi:hypothetical protein
MPNPWEKSRTCPIERTVETKCPRVTRPNSLATPRRLVTRRWLKTLYRHNVMSTDASAQFAEAAARIQSRCSIAPRSRFERVLRLPASLRANSSCEIFARSRLWATCCPTSNGLISRPKMHRSTLMIGT